MTLLEAVDYALAHSPDLSISESGVKSARAKLSATRAERLPSIQAASSVQYWDGALSFSAGPGAPPLVVRERTTTASSLTAALPLSHQIVIGKLVAADRHGLEASRADNQSKRLEVASNAAQSYLQVLLARSTRDIAKARTGLVKAQLDRARVLKQGGVLGKVDVMRLEAALASARGDAITAQANAESAEDALAYTLGLPRGQGIDLVDDLPDTAKLPPPPGPAQAVEAASKNRPDLAAAWARAEQARAGAAVQLSQLLPAISAVGQLQHNTGNGPFYPENAWFVGLSLSWNLWDWGSTYHNYKSASYQADAARTGASRAADGIRVQVRRAARDTRAAYDQLEVARAGLAAAEEAFRIQQARFDEGATTTTELLAAETEVTQARVGFASARDGYFIQLVRLAQATGQLPATLLPTGQGAGSPGTP